MERILPQAWDLLADLPGTAAEEIHAAVRVLTPLRRPAHGQVSTSSREAFGGVALSPPADALALAVRCAQEAQHAKLGRAAGPGHADQARRRAALRRAVV